MDSRLRTLTTAHGGVLSADGAHRLGLTDVDLRLAVRRGELIRVRRGAYVLADLYGSSAPTEQFRLRVASVLATRPGSLAAHHAGLAVHRLPLVDVDLRRIDIAAPVRHGSSRSGVRTSPIPDGEILDRVDGVRVLSVPSCIVQTAAASGVVAGVVALDAALHRGSATVSAVVAAAARLEPRFGAAAVRATLSLADSHCESPGESRTRLILSGLGLPFQSQVTIRDASGEVVARPDFLVAGRVIVEFDGAVKYAGAQGRDALIREKQREDWLRAQGYEVVRLTWADLDHPDRVERLIRAALTRAGRRLSLAG